MTTPNLSKNQENKELKEIVIPELPTFDEIVKKYPNPKRKTFKSTNQIFPYYQKHKNDQDIVSRLAALSLMSLSLIQKEGSESTKKITDQYLDTAFTQETRDNLFFSLDHLIDELDEMSKALSEDALEQKNLRLLKNIALKQAKIDAVISLFIHSERGKDLCIKSIKFGHNMDKYCVDHPELDSKNEYFNEIILKEEGGPLNWYANLYFGRDEELYSDVEDFQTGINEEVNQASKVK